MSGKKATLRQEQEAVHRAADTVIMVRLAALAVLEVTGISVATGTGTSGRTAGMSEEDAHLQAAANYIRSGHFREALNVLDGIANHSALWYFLSASANSGLGTM